MAHSVTFKPHPENMHYEIRDENNVLVSKRIGYTAVMADLRALDGISATEAFALVKAAYFGTF